MNKHDLLADPTETSQPFWDATSRNELRIQRCRDCERWVFYPRELCPGCFGAALSWEVVEGTGEIHTYSVVHRAAVPEYEQDAPYVLAIVELDEGVRLMANILDCEGDDVSIGERVRVVFEDRNGRQLPQFELER